MRCLLVDSLDTPSNLALPSGRVRAADQLRPSKPPIRLPHHAPTHPSPSQLAFNSRVRIYHAWQNADAHLRRTKQTHEASRAQGRLSPEQLSRSLQLVGEAERRALDAKQEFDHVSRLVKQEAARFEQERVDDFKAALEAFLEGMIDRQKQVRPGISSARAETAVLTFVSYL